LMAFTPTNPEADAALKSMFPRLASGFSWAEAILRGKSSKLPMPKSNLMRCRPCARSRSCEAGAARCLSRCRPIRNQSV
jgi:hypothetical protein